MDDHVLVFLEPPIHGVPADADETLCEPIFITPSAVPEHTEPHVLRRKTPARQPVLLVEHLRADAVDHDLATHERANPPRKGVQILDAL
jgi:hypothetical protein